MEHCKCPLDLTDESGTCKSCLMPRVAEIPDNMPAAPISPQALLQQQNTIIQRLNDIEFAINRNTEAVVNLLNLMQKNENMTLEEVQKRMQFLNSVRVRLKKKQGLPMRAYRKAGAA